MSIMKAYNFIYDTFGDKAVQRITTTIKYENPNKCSIHDGKNKWTSLYCSECNYKIIDFGMDIEEL